MRSRILATVLLSATLVATACSSNAEPTSATPSASTPAATTAPKTTAAASGGSGGAVAGALLGAKFCSDWTDVSTKTPSSAAPAPAGPGGLPSTADMKASIEATNASMKALADQAPAEIKPDFQVYAKFWSDYAALMAKANYSYLGAAQDPAFLTLMQSSAGSLQTAAQNIQAYMLKNCTR